MPTLTQSKIINSTLIGKRLEILAGDDDTDYQIRMPEGATSGFANGDFIDFHLGSLGDASQVSFLADAGEPVISQGPLVRSQQFGRIYYTGSSWVVTASLPISTVPVFKPAPLIVGGFFSATHVFGASYDYNAHYRNVDGTPVNVVVKADSYWPGNLEYWRDDFEPVIDSPMPIGGSTIFTVASTGGTITFSADPGVTINSPASLTLSAAFGKATLTKVGPNEWDLEGRLDP